MRRAHAGLSVLALLTLASASDAEDLPPWTDRGEVPLPSWVRSVAPNRAESAIYAEPGRTDLRRGSIQAGARLPLFGVRRGAGCQGRWLNVGPLAWTCSDVADMSPDEPVSPPLGTKAWLGEADEWTRPRRAGAGRLPPIEPLHGTDDGLPFRYFFAGRDGASGFASLENALDDAPDQELEPGFAVAVVEERSAHGERWVRTKKGRWVATRELTPARANLFHGELIAPDPGDKLDVAWVVAEHATVFATEKGDKAIGARVRFEKVTVKDERGAFLRIEPDGWMRAKDVARPRVAPPPPEVVLPHERWIDVDLAQQALVAYEGPHPVFATIVSSGKGPRGSEFATHPGTFRIWVKIFTTKMDNLDKDEVERHYAIEDVPWVQFFDKAIAFHGAFWHRDFGHAHSHGCVNMAPLDARWLFAFTSPHLPVGWNAVMPMKLDEGAVVRVR